MIAPWQTPEWLEQMRGTMRTNAFLRMIENRFVSNESQFVESEWLERCIDKNATPVVSDTGMPVIVGVDASVKRDSTGIVAVTWDRNIKKVRVVFHRIFQPTQSSPLDFEGTIERTVRELIGRFSVEVFIMIHSKWRAPHNACKRLVLRCVNMRSRRKISRPMGNNLYELIKGAGIVFYPDDAIKKAIGHAVAKKPAAGKSAKKNRRTRLT